MTVTRDYKRVYGAWQPWGGEGGGVVESAEATINSGVWEMTAKTFCLLLFRANDSGSGHWQALWNWPPGKEGFAEYTEVRRVSGDPAV